MAAVIAATLTTIEILGLIGITSATNAIRDDMLTEPEGIGHLNDEDAKGIQMACSAYAKRPTATRFTVTRVQKKRLTSLMYWVKYKVRLGKPTEFAGTYAKADLRVKLESAMPLAPIIIFRWLFSSISQRSRWIADSSLT